MPTCTCPHPTLYLDQYRELSCTCGDTPRKDLGGQDDLARVRYRARYNRLLAKEWRPTIDKAQAINDHFYTLCKHSREVTP